MKERILRVGRDVILVFNEDVGFALRSKLCDLDADGDAVHLARAAKIIMLKM